MNKDNQEFNNALSAEEKAIKGIPPEEYLRCFEVGEKCWAALF